MLTLDMRMPVNKGATVRPSFRIYI
uniref:Uncharacterized protein n=1 Tax=Ralstonia syzygii R24 TaxID=907261 RepID=G2ZZ97_9RALS|nr:hypothetical protein RALSY_10152 [Ralstonia syzygii R24]